jgi:hypothetical protein
MIPRILIAIGIIVLAFIIVQAILGAVSTLVQCLCWGVIALTAISILMRLIRPNPAR